MLKEKYSPSILIKKFQKNINNQKIYILFLITLAVATYHLVSFSFYLHGTLEGKIDNHILAAEMWGTPDKMHERGLQPLYYGPVQTGWDGQFYFYIANDLLAQEDTPEHIDSPSYRYQRVGMSLYAAIVSYVFGKGWVSPASYFISYFFLILIASWFATKLLIEKGLDPLFALFWPLSIGTQITMFNALPDAAADSFLILGLVALYAGSIPIAIIPLTFAALSREVYILFPCFIAAMYILEYSLNQSRNINTFLHSIKTCFLQSSACFLAIPVLIVISWQSFVTWRFGITASSQAHGILGPPLVAWFEYFLAGLRNTHPVVRSSVSAWSEAIALLFFLLSLIYTLFLALFVLLTNKAKDPITRGIALTAISLSILYSCFGPTVIKYYTGYLKAVSIFYLLIPLLLAFATPLPRWRTICFTFLCIILLACSYYNWRVRILPGPSYDRYTRISQITDEREMTCLSAYNAKVELRSLEFIDQTGIRGLITGAKKTLIAHIALQNLGETPLVSTKKGVGSVYMSYQWLDGQGKIWRDGVRSAIIEPLQAKDTAEIAIIAKIPATTGKYTLRLSPVQEGCAWFYVENIESAQDINFQVR